MILYFPSKEISFAGKLPKLMQQDEVIPWLEIRGALWGIRAAEPRQIAAGHALQEPVPNG
jgi:hypothetical protein